MMRANIDESEEQSMARFMNGLNYLIKKIVEFQPYASLVELVHQATKAESHVIEELKYIKTKAFFASKPSSSTPPMAQESTQSNAKASTRPPQSSSRASSTLKKPTITSSTPQAFTTKPSYVTCFKCGGQGHKSFECSNTKVMVVNDNGEYESMSEGEYNALNQVATLQSVDEDNENIFCDGDHNPPLVVTRVLTTNLQD